MNMAAITVCLPTLASRHKSQSPSGPQALHLPTLAFPTVGEPGTAGADVAIAPDAAVTGNVAYELLDAPGAAVAFLFLLAFGFFH